MKGQSPVGRSIFNAHIRKILGLPTDDNSKITIGVGYTKDSGCSSAPRSTKKPNRKTKVQTVYDPRELRTRQYKQSIDIQSLWPRQTIPSKDHSSQSNLFNSGFCVQKARYCSYRISQERSHLLVEGTKKPMDLTVKEPKAMVKSEVPPKPKRQIPTPTKPKSASEPPKKVFTAFIPRKNTRKIEIVSVKDAMRDKEWLIRARDQILRDLMSSINRSNGIHAPPAENIQYFKYHLGPGNNSSLVRQVLATRFWWVRVNEEEKDTANLVWTQCKDKEFMEQLPCIDPNETRNPTAEKGSSIVCNTKYLSHTLDTICPIQKQVDLSPLSFDLLTRSDSYTGVDISNSFPGEIQIHNKLEGNAHLSNKKGLFYNMVAYYRALSKNPFNYIPLTFHVSGHEDIKFQEFTEAYTPSSLWIVKPGENSNRGYGINVCGNLSEIRSEITGGDHTFIIQKYIERPFLVHKRKFDIRCYAMVTSYNGVIQGYFYNEGYIRTSSKSFTLGNLYNKLIHLTNDAVQKKSEDYGKFENGNKMSYNDFQRYLDNYTDSKANFSADVLPQIKEMVKHTIEAVFLKINPNGRAFTFEVFGYDFLLDADLKPWLIEVNTNPCLELASPHLARIIPAMLENSFKIALDSLFPEPYSNKRPFEVFSENKYELIFHSLVDGIRLVEELKERGTFGLIENTGISELSDVEEDHPDDPIEDLAA